METPPKNAKGVLARRVRVFALVLLLGVLWYGLHELNRPEMVFNDQPLSYWMERMGNERTAAHAASVLSELGPEAMPALIEALRADSHWLEDAVYAVAVKTHLAAPRSYDAPNIRATAAYLLGQMGRRAAQATPALIKALGDEDAFVRFKASRALATFGMPAVAQLKLALESPEPVVRYGAAKALGGIGPQAKYAAPSLMKCLHDPQPNVRDAAFYALSQIGSNAQKNFRATHVPQLVEALTNSTWTASRKFAIKTLTNFGPKAKEALPALTAAKQSWPELSNEIHEALAVIGK